jgi:Kelch motif
MRIRIARRSLLASVTAFAFACSDHAATSTPEAPVPTVSIPVQTFSGARCATPGTTAPPGCWQEILPLGSGGFPAAPGSDDRPVWEPGRFPLTLPPGLAFNDELWMTAQTLTYSSPDGLTWNQHDKTDWGERIYHSIVYFKGKLWMYGGLDYQARTFLNDVWASSDGTTWEHVGTAAWPARGGQTMVVYQDKLWLFGGADHAAPDRSTDGFLNDVWLSDDGITWTEVTDAAPWSARDRAGVLVFNGELYLVGGQGRADVWRSSNGKDWIQLTAEADWKPRHDDARAVFDGKIWVFGGWTGTSTNALNDVWYSTDGTTWERQAEHAPWAPRAPISIVFLDRIWIYSGKHTGSDDSWGGDLWQMTAATTQTR